MVILTRSTQRAQTSLAEADHYSHILPTVKMLSLGCERLHPPFKKKIGSGSLPVPRSGYAITSMVFFAHLLILQYPDHHQNLISSSLYYSGPLHKISSQSVHNFLSNVVHRQTDKQTDRQTNQRYQKHNLLCQGGNYINKTPAVNKLVRSCYKKYKQVLVYILEYLLHASWYVPVREPRILRAYLWR